MNNDLISRSALLERLAFKRDHNRLYKKSTYPGLESAISQVKKAPAVDAVEVVNGRWETAHIIGEPLFGYDPFEVDVFACSVCGAHFDVSEALNYCPNCGAKMDGGEDNGTK